MTAPAEGIQPVNGARQPVRWFVLLTAVGLLCGACAHRSATSDPVVSQIKSDEVVLFYPTFARLDPDGTSWTIPVRGMISEPEAKSVKRGLLVSDLRRSLGSQWTAEESAMFERRLRLFLVDHERGKTIRVRIGEGVHEVGTSGPDGHFGSEVRLTADDVEGLSRSGRVRDGWLSFEAIMRQGDDRRFAGRVLLAEPGGLAIISDIDDTIKVTDVRSRMATLANTFLRPFKPVPGMADLYGRFARAKATFHYVSASPWQLYEPLQEFCDKEGFPPGSFSMKHFRLTDSSVLNLFGSQEEHKTQAIEEILLALPARRFVMIGDSGEQDPEIYGRIARDHAGRVAAIFIRNVTRETADGPRFRKAMQGVPQQQWKLFDAPAELQGISAELIEKYAGKPSVP